MKDEMEFETLDEALEHIDILTERLAELETVHTPGTWPLIIHLDPPISNGSKGEPVSELQMREPTMGDLAGIPVHPEHWTFTHLLNVGQKLTKVGDSQKCITMAMLKKIPSKQGHIITTAMRIFLLECL